VTDTKQDGGRERELAAKQAERLERFPATGRPVLDRAIGAFNVGRESLTVLAMVLDDGRQNAVQRLDAAVCAAARARAAAGAFLDTVTAAHQRAGQPPARYEVTCPECGKANVTAWNDDVPPGGVDPVKCKTCGFMILSESEGNPVAIPENGGETMPSAAGEPMPEGPATASADESEPGRESVRHDGAVNLTDSQKVTAINELAHGAWTSGVAATESLGESDNYVSELGARVEENVEEARHFFAEALERTEIALRLIQSWRAGDPAQSPSCETDEESGSHEMMRRGDQKRRSERHP